MKSAELMGISVVRLTGQKSHNLTSSHHASHFLKCPIDAWAIIKVSGHQRWWLAGG